MPVRTLYAMLIIGIGLAGAIPSQAQDASSLPYQNPAPAKSSGPDLKPGANSFAESQAKKLLESKGYSQVSSLTNDSNGIWRGTATKDDRTVDVSVDFQGHVAAK